MFLLSACCSLLSRRNRIARVAWQHLSYIGGRVCRVLQNSPFHVELWRGANVSKGGNTSFCKKTQKSHWILELESVGEVTPNEAR